jgi:peptide/nickel transport system permease protein
VRGKLLARRLGWRLAAGAGVMWGAATFAFVTLHATAGDIALTTVSANGSDPTEAVLQEVRRQYGLNLPLWRQYVDYLWKLLHGNLGQSYQQHIPVTSAIGMQLVPTLELAGAAAVTSVVLAVVVAVLTAKRRSWVRALTTGTELVLASMPTFVVGLLLLIVFGLELDVVAHLGQHRLAKSLVLPVLDPGPARLRGAGPGPPGAARRGPGAAVHPDRPGPGHARDGRPRCATRLRHASIQLVTMSGYVIGSLLGGSRHRGVPVQPPGPGPAHARRPPRPRTYRW